MLFRTHFFLAACLGLAACSGDKDTTPDDGVTTPDGDADTDADADADSDADTDTTTSTTTTTTLTTTTTTTVQQCADFSLGNLVPQSVAGTTIGQGDDVAPSCSTTSTAADYTYEFIAPANGEYAFTTLRSDYDTVVDVRDGCSNVVLGCDDDEYGRGSMVFAQMTAGQMALVIVDGFGANEGNYTLDIFEVEATETDCTDLLDNDVNGLPDCLDIACAADAACLPVCPEVAVAGNSVTGATYGLNDDVDISCNTPFEATSDQTLEFTVPAPGRYAFELTGVGIFSTAMAVFDDCGGTELACDAGFGDPSIVAVEFAQATTAMVVVSGTSGYAGEYQVDMYAVPFNEVNCADGIDDDVDGDTDCFDADCDFDAACYEDCFNDIDDDGDGLRDCQDGACFGLQACVEICDNGVDEDDDFNIDCFDSDCDFDALCFEDCENGIDDDLDLKVDCLDGACAADPTCIEVCPQDTLPTAPGNISGSTLGRVNDYAPTCGGSAASDWTIEVTAPADGEYVFDTYGSAYDTVLAVFEDCSAAVQLACDDDASGTTQSQVVLTMTAGQTVAVVVDGFLSNSGDFEMHVTPRQANEIDCADGRDEDADEDIDCADADCALFPGCVEVCDNGLDEDADGDVDCEDADCALFPACIEVCDNGLDEDVDGDVDCEDADCALDANCQPVCPELTLPAAPSQAVGSTLGLLPDQTGSCGGAAAADITYTFTAGAAGMYTFDTFGSVFDTVLYVLDACGGLELACDDDTAGVQSEVTVMLNANQTVVVVVDGFGTNSGDYILNVQ